MSEFKRVSILGPGLLGGSIALAWEARHGSDTLALWARRSERATELRNHGFVHVHTELADALAGSDLVILAAPVGAMESLADKVLECDLAPGVLVTDVGSVKGLPHRLAGSKLRAAGVNFLGSHPMAGSEQSGFAAARADLLAGAPCIITNEDDLDDALVGRLISFWSGLGMRTAVMSADEHDRLVARISHVPHALAVACALVALEDRDHGQFSGGGLRDTSRVAAGDPELWTEIFLENREAILEPLRESGHLIMRLADLIEKGQEDALATVLEEAQSRRLSLPDQTP